MLDNRNSRVPLLLLLLLLLCLSYCPSFSYGALIAPPANDGGGGGGVGEVTKRVQFVFRRRQSSFTLREFNATYLPQVMVELRAQARLFNLPSCSDRSMSGRGVCVRFDVDYPTVNEWSELQVAALLVRTPPYQPAPDELRAFASLALAETRLRAIGDLAQHLEVTTVWRGSDAPDGSAWAGVGGSFGGGIGGGVGTTLRAALPAAAAAAAVLTLAALLAQRLRRRSRFRLRGRRRHSSIGSAASSEVAADADLPSRPVRFRGNSDRPFVDVGDAADRFVCLVRPTGRATPAWAAATFLPVPGLEPWWPDGFALGTDAASEALLGNAWDANCTVVCSLRPHCAWLPPDACGAGGGGKFRLSARRASCYPSHTLTEVSLACLDSNLMKRLTLCSFTAAWDPDSGLPVNRANFVRFASACGAAIAAAPPSARALFVGPGPGLTAAALLPAFLAAAAEVRGHRSCDLVRLVAGLGRHCPLAELGPPHYVFLLECLHLYAFMLRQGIL